MLICKIIQTVFFTYTIMLIVRCLASWIPQVNKYKIMHFLMFYTDPYLNFFRRIIPPIGGVLDLSPVLAFFALRALEYIIIRVLC